MENNSLSTQNQQLQTRETQLQPAAPQQIAQPAETVTQPAVYTRQPQQMQYAAQPAKKSGKGKGLGLGIPGLVLGIISLFYTLYVLLAVFILGAAMSYEGSYYTSDAGVAIASLLIAYAVMGMFFAIPGIILSALAKKHLNSGLTKTGFVLSLISIILLALMFVGGIAIIFLFI